MALCPAIFKRETVVLNRSNLLHQAHQQRHVLGHGLIDAHLLVNLAHRVQNR